MENTDQITYRVATGADIQILIDNRLLFARELCGEKPQDEIDRLRDQMHGYFQKAIANDSCISVIAECRSKVAGVGSVHLSERPGNFTNPSGKWGYIMSMYTVPQFRRKGICKGVLNALMEEGRKKGTCAFELHATEEGEKVYRKNGFLIHNEPTYRRFF